VAEQKKKSIDIVKLQVGAGKANPAPPIGTALGPKGIDIAGFCKQFNEQTKNEKAGRVFPVEVYIKSDRSFTFKIKMPPAAVLILEALAATKGSGEPNKAKIGTLSRQQIEGIATVKMPDLNAIDLAGAVKIIAGTARSMGVEVEGV
jgi:large subunit ribosomal protein L11